jgi:hypothetical protein
MKRLCRAEPASFFTAWATVGLAVFLSGCTVSTPASIVSTQGRFPDHAEVQLAPYEADGSLRANFGRALSDALSADSVIMTATAPLIAEFAVSARAAETGIADPARSTGDNIAWESSPRARGRFENCHAIRLRSTLILLDRAEGTILYRGVAEKDGCSYSEADLNELAYALVRDAQGQFAPN